ncbi:hypothetical protein [Pseudoduganella violacea]|uniref:DUF3617 family protein n=1 Tax=Pseudoduganella violacea TaxID=1715466 RepID=A0A7W5B6Q7_9BURK|nr:hypothetical protein [Pseudoduganella violacea]MBB3117556.1 hypothetical protein [Pseudoduganella violacea]
MKKNCKAKAFVVLAMFFANGLGHTQVSGKIGGTWEGFVGQKILRMDVVTLKPEDGYVAAEFAVAEPGCSGGIAGIGKVKGNSMVLTQYMANKDERSCMVTMQFDEKGETVKVSESSCSDFHGASCNFSGEMRRVRPN